jgi:hypothetical protein
MIKVFAPLFSKSGHFLCRSPRDVGVLFQANGGRVALRWAARSRKAGAFRGKRRKKLFYFLACGVETAAAKGAKFFASLVDEKEGAFCGAFHNRSHCSGA